MEEAEERNALIVVGDLYQRVWAQSGISRWGICIFVEKGANTHFCNLKFETIGDRYEFLH